MEYLRTVPLLKTRSLDNMVYPEETMNRLRALAGRFDMNELMNILLKFSSMDLRRNPYSTLSFEMAIVQTCYESSVTAATSPVPVQSAARGTQRPELPVSLLPLPGGPQTEN